MTRLAASFLCAIWALAACSQAPDANSARIAVATNFKPVMDVLETRFEAQTDYEVEVVTGSTGALYAQITQGAPFDVFLSADQARPKRLEESGHAITDTIFTYAIGQLVLWSPEAEPVSLENLKSPELRRFTIANPELAPYGKAALSVLEKLGLSETLKDRLVLGENIGQAFAYIKTGNAELGFVALSQVLSLPENERGTYLQLDRAFYGPIRQDAQLLKRGAENPAAEAFLAFLRSEEAADIIAPHGYIAP